MFDIAVNHGSPVFIMYEITVICSNDGISKTLPYSSARRRSFCQKLFLFKHGFGSL